MLSSLIWLRRGNPIVSSKGIDAIIPMRPIKPREIIGLMPRLYETFPMYGAVELPIVPAPEITPRARLFTVVGKSSVT